MLLSNRCTDKGQAANQTQPCDTLCEPDDTWFRIINRMISPE